MITHDELIYCIQQQYPDAVHGTDFWVGQSVDRNTGAQLEDARLYVWKRSDAQPTDEEIMALVQVHGVAAQRFVRARDVRIQRDIRLKMADTLAYKAMDLGDSEKMQMAGQYRQALRDVPAQPDFPDNTTWPVLPEALAPLLPTEP